MRYKFTKINILYYYRTLKFNTVIINVIDLFKFTISIFKDFIKKIIN